MSSIKNKNLSFLLAFALLVSMLIPSIASAYSTNGSASNPTLTIHKYQQEPGTARGPAGDGTSAQAPVGETGLAGVEFTLTLKEVFNPAATLPENQWTPAPAQTKLTGTTNAAGEIVFNRDNGLQLGRYEVKETNGPANVILNADTFEVDVPMTSLDGNNLNYDVHIYPKNQTIRKDVELTKNGPDGTPLNGIKFKLFRVTGNAGLDSETSEQVGPDLETADPGKIIVPNLEQGKYYFIETETSTGYALNNQKIYFDIVKANEDGLESPTAQTPTLKWTNIDRFATDGTVVNNTVPDIFKTINDGLTSFDVNRNETYKYNINVKLPADIDLYKELKVTDVLDSRLAFVTDFTGDNIQAGWKVEGIDRSAITFAQTGQTLTWNVNDFSKLSGATEFTITFTSKIRANAESIERIPNQGIVDFDNNRGQIDSDISSTVLVGPTEGGFEIFKTDKADDSPLEGAEFKLTTDEAGENVVETQDTAIKVNGRPSMDPEGKLQRLISEDTGRILITGLPTGDYYLHETKAPVYTENGTVKSYRLLTKPVKFTIRNSEPNQTITVKNSKSGWVLPTTGGMGTILFTLVGLALMAIAVFAYMRRRKNIQE